MNPNLKIALVGCGQIADAHLTEICKIPRVRLSGVCDRHAALAEQAAMRFGVPERFTDLSSMLERLKPDVLHVTTPPQTHRNIALQAFAAGANVYIEKPFALDQHETAEILAAARAAGRQVCVGHDQIFDPVWLAARQMITRGELGDVVHVESIQGYDLSGPFGKALSAEPDHWVRRLPGGLFQNTISHALYKITEFLSDETPVVCGKWRDLQRVGFFTDLRAMIWGEKVSGHLVFTSLARPVQRVVRIFGTRSIIEVDFDSQTIRQSRKLALPGALGKIEAPFRQAAEGLKSLGKSIVRFARSDIHYFAGMNRLFTLFYESIRGEIDAPIRPEEILRVTAIMDRMFQSCRLNSQTAGPALELAEGTSDAAGRAPLPSGVRP